jgi:hypothetical protein
LRYNLPVPEKTGSYEVLTEEPIPQGDDVDK